MNKNNFRYGKKRIELLTGTVPVNNRFLLNPLLPGTVPVNNFLLTGSPGQ